MFRALLVVWILAFVGCGDDSSNASDPWLSKKELLDPSFVSADVNNNSIADNVEKDLLNNNPQKDTYESELWYLSKLRIDEINKQYMGYKDSIYMHIQVVDEGVEKDHEDLVDNLDTIRSIDAVSGKSGILGINGPHGTRCAGIIAARGYNGIGTRGIAPFAKISSVNWIKNQQITELEKAWFSGDGANDIVVSSNSWGSCTNYKSTAQEQERILSLGASLLRYGLGRVYVFSAGNSRDGGYGCPTGSIGSANLDEARNNQYVITVAALKKDDTFASYSNSGSNILISAYGGAGDASDYIYTPTKGNAYTKFAGTSASAPVISGVVALILEACPRLDYKEVQYLIAKTATLIDKANPNWVKNSAGMYHSIDYGYGKINPVSAINACKKGLYKLPQSFDVTKDVKVSKAINANTNIQVDITIDKAFKARWVGVNIDGRFNHFNNVDIYLISPQGVKTQLIHKNSPLYSMNENIRLGSFAFIDEPTKGVWKLEINNKNTADILNSVSLNIVGH